MKCKWWIVLVITILTLVVGCEDGSEVEGFNITDYDVGKDTLNIDFSRAFSSFSPPNVLTIETDEYNIDVYRDDGTTNLFRLGHYGVLSSTSTSLEIAILGDFDLDDGNYNIKIYTGDPINDPDVLMETENFMFADWTDTNTEVHAIKADPAEIYVSVTELTGDTALVDLVKADFSLFSMDGTKVDFNFLNGSAADPLLPDHEYQLTPISGTFSGMYYVRFAKAGYDPDNVQFTIGE